MTNLARNANVYRVALILGAINISDVVAWADSEIEVSTTPPNPLIDVSMGRSLPINKIISLLSELALDKKDRASIQRALGLVADQIRRNLMSVETAIMNCYLFFQSEHLLYDDEFSIFINLEDDLSLIRDGGLRSR